MQYLVLYTKLLCKFQRNEVHEFVKKDYYPINECLELCRAEKIPKAIAELLKRNGNYLESLETYLDIIDKLDMVEMIKELHSSLK